jgi:hypothetical protein
MARSNEWKSDRLHGWFHDSGATALAGMSQTKGQRMLRYPRKRRAIIAA